MSRPLVHAGARRRARQVRQRLTDRVAEVADTEVLRPLAEARADHDRFCAAVALARS